MRESAETATVLDVAIDCTSLLEANRTGVGRMVNAVVRAVDATADVSLTAFAVSVRGRHRLASLVPPGVATVDPPIPARLAHRVWQRWSRPRIDRLVGRPDVVHGPNFVVPPADAATVVTVHDLTTVRFPELCHPSTRGFPDQVQRAIDGGAWVHAVSHAVAEEIRDHFHVEADRVRAIPNGFDPAPPGDAARGRALAGVDDFVLAVGTVEPRKGLPLLVDAVGRLAADGRRMPVVHVGPDGWGVDAFDAAVGALPPLASVRRVGARSSEDLADLYAAARLVAYPSRYEGFGLPVLEAQAAGTPVVASADPAIVEVAGGAAVIVDGRDADDWAAALAATWDDDAGRAERRAAGRANAARYDWATTATGLVDLYRTAAADRDHRYR